jgi:hydroxymethylpyrimidine/phosphomethylpyrimidine kinase
MSKRQKLPVALTIAGSDSGGGAGVQADLKTFAAVGVHGTSAITCITAQNPKEIRGVEAGKPPIVRQQIEAVFAEFPPRAVKTGMLCSAGIVRVVIDFFKGRQRPPLIVDPVMVATSGTRLLEPSAIKLLEHELLPIAMLVTPNADETEILTGKKMRTVDDLRWAARGIQTRFGCAALIKGGHLKGLREAIDIFYDGKTELLLSAPFIPGVSTHGTGCTYSAAIAAYLALGCDLICAVELAKNYITQAIAQCHVVQGYHVLNNLWND